MIKKIQDSNNVKAPEHSHTAELVYAVVKDGVLKHLAYYDQNHKQEVSIVLAHAIGNWLQKNGVNVIPNVRFGDERTYEICCCGVQKYGTIAIGTHGCVKNKVDRAYLIAGIEHVVRKLNPEIIVIYGSAPADIFDRYKNLGITILQFDSSFAKSRRGDCYGNG